MLDDVIQFRLMTLDDIPAGLALCRSARWNQLQHEWELFLRLSPLGCCVAVKDGCVVGTVTTVSYQNRFRQDCFSWIGMVLVDPASRRQGIGRQLLEEAISILSKQAVVGLDATPAGREVYLQLGFVDDCRLSRMETVASYDVACGENDPARQMTEADLPNLFEADRNAFGAERRELLEWLFAGAPEYAWLIERDGKVAGYAFGRHGFHFEHLGPVIAEDVEVAKQLVRAVLAKNVGKTFILDATQHDEEWTRWLTSVGFREARPFIRMFRGSGDRPQVSKQQFAILGPEFG